MEASGACDFGLFKHNLCSVLEPKTVRKCRTRVASASLEITHGFRIILLPSTESGYTSDLSEQLSGRVFTPSSPYGWLRMDAPEGGGLCALKGGTRQVKFGADQEGAHRQKRDRRVPPTPRSPLLSSSQRTKVGPGGEEEVERVLTSHAGRDGSGGEMDLCDSSRGFVGARLVRFIRDLSSSRCRCDAVL